MTYRKLLRPLITLSIALALSACGTPAPLDSRAAAPVAKQAGAPLFDGMGDHHLPITTTSPQAQRYFDQGMVLAFGFNHAESIRSFRAAQKLDRSCAMCFWGEALATGPNINVTSQGKPIMSPEDRVAAFAALTQARNLMSGANVVERDYIEALTSRYDGDPETDRAPLDIAYANAMRKLADKYPDDDDAVSLFAEALMNTMPWNYWAEDGNPRPATIEVINALETVMARAPRHPLALHLYIHAVEASSRPGRAEAAADQLVGLVPGSGHLVHMPAHIFWRVGRYHEASDANVRAAAVDEDYIAQCNAQGFYPALYYPHNIHFLWAASSMEGRSDVAIEAALKVAANVHLEQIEKYPTVEFFKTIPMLAYTQFGRWDEVLAIEQPPEKLDYSNAIWRYVRGVAYARKGDMPAARQELAALQPLLATEKIHTLDGNDYPASALLHIANELLLGEIALAEHETAQAIKHFEIAVATQDDLPYTEPPFWYYPTRQSLGVALLRARRFEEAEAVYRHDLADYPRNGWSMFGLAQSLRAQGQDDEALAMQNKFERVWSLADVQLTESRL